MDIEERNQQILYLEPRIRKLAIKYGGQRFSEDLYDVGIETALIALTKFDSSRGVKPWTYVAYCVKGAMLSSMRREVWMYRFKRSCTASKQEKASDQLEDAELLSLALREAQKLRGRMHAVFQLWLAGLTDLEISRRLNISPRLVSQNRYLGLRSLRLKLQRLTRGEVPHSQRRLDNKAFLCPFEKP